MALPKDQRHPGILRRSEIESIGSWHSSLRYERGVLQFGGIDLASLLANSPRPSIIYDLGRLGDNIAALRESMDRYGNPFDIAFAVKACHTAPCLEAIADAGAGMEIMSRIELEMALLAGCPPDRIISNGVGRTQAYSDAVARAGVGLVIVDSLHDLESTARSARLVGRSMRVALRATFGPNDGGRFVDTTSKLGVSASDGSLDQLLSAATGLASVEVIGIHAHQLARCSDPRAWAAAVKDLVDVADGLSLTHGLGWRIVDVGGGLDSRIMARIAGLNLDDWADICMSEIQRLGGDALVLVEPGRFIASDAAVGLTRVCGEKVVGGASWLITELGSNALIPVEGAVYQPIPLRINPTDQWNRYNIGDRACTPTALAIDVDLPESVAETGVAFINCGAYTTVFSEAWAFSPPEVRVIHPGGEIRQAASADPRELWRLLHGWTGLSSEACYEWEVS